MLFDNGAGQSPTGTASAGDPYAGFERTSRRCPVPDDGAAAGTSGPAGHDFQAADVGRDRLVHVERGACRSRTTGNTGGSGLWGDASGWQWNWQQNPAGTAVSYVSAPLKANTTVIGDGGVYLWVRSSTPDVDLQATISEVRPDGNETFVQNGWIRASERKLSTTTDNMFDQKPRCSNQSRRSGGRSAPMPAGQFVQGRHTPLLRGARVPGGSRIRVTISAPNGAQPVWSFARPSRWDGDGVDQLVADDAVDLVLPVVPGMEVPTPLPACPSLRNEPCRKFQAIVNNASAG